MLVRQQYLDRRLVHEYHRLHANLTPPLELNVLSKEHLSNQILQDGTGRMPQQLHHQSRQHDNAIS